MCIMSIMCIICMVRAICVIYIVFIICIVHIIRLMTILSDNFPALGVFAVRFPLQFIPTRWWTNLVDQIGSNRFFLKQFNLINVQNNIFRLFLWLLAFLIRKLCIVLNFLLGGNIFLCGRVGADLLDWVFDGFL